MIFVRLKSIFVRFNKINNHMDPLTWVLAVVAALSEILPLVGITHANGIVHAAQQFIVHVHARSDCHVEVEVDVETRSPNQSPQRNQPPSQSSNIASSSTTAAAASGTTAGTGTTTGAPGAGDGPAAITSLLACPP